MLECITEKVPFLDPSRDAAAIHARISKQQYPPRPDGEDPKKRSLGWFMVQVKAVLVILVAGDGSG